MVWRYVHIPFSSLTSSMGFIESFLSCGTETGLREDDLAAFVTQEVEEGLNLEYKDIRKLQEPEDLGIAVSAFANSAGGLLIVGVSEKTIGPRTVPDRITWNRNSKLTRDWFESVVLRRIQPPVIGARVITVPSSSGETVFLVDVPASVSMPHMAPDGRYYYRIGASAIRMEHYQVMDAFGKRVRPILTPSLSISEIDTNARKFRLSYDLSNDGKAIAKWIFLQMRIIGCAAEESKPVVEKFFRKEATAPTTLEGRPKSFWESISHEKGEAGLGEITVSFSSPIQVLHAGLVQSFPPVPVQMEGPLILVKLLVCAEDAPTNSYATFIGESWLSKRIGERTTLKKLPVPLFREDEYMDPEVKGRFRLWVKSALAESLAMASEDYLIKLFKQMGLDLDAIKRAEAIDAEKTGVK